MFNLEKIVRKNILKILPYSTARDEFSAKDGVFLDANENPFGTLNRYPDPHQLALKTKLSALQDIPLENIFIGNGSDEVIDIAYRVFCNPGQDKALTFPPTYGMYEVSAGTNDVALIKIPLTSSFQIDFNPLENHLSDECLKLIFVCSPNNPTGNHIQGVERILQQYEGIVLVDEAYIDFSDQASLLQKTREYPNLIVSQTFSKARGLAAARVGVAYANPAIISLFNKVKAPYNVSAFNQQAALASLEDQARFEVEKRIILEQKKSLEKQLNGLEIVKKVYPSDANFILVETSDADAIYAELLRQNVITRNRNSVLQNCIRITVGSADENKQLIDALYRISNAKK